MVGPNVPVQKLSFVGLQSSSSGFGAKCVHPCMIRGRKLGLKKRPGGRCGQPTLAGVQSTTKQRHFVIFKLNGRSHNTRIIPEIDHGAQHVSHRRVHPP